MSGQQHGTVGEEGLSAMGVGLAVPTMPRKARSVSSISGTWEWACPDKIKHETKQKPCQEFRWKKKQWERVRFSMPVSIAETP